MTFDIREEIKKAKPNISDSSIKTYYQSIKMIRQMMKLPSEMKSLDFLKDTKKVIDTIEKHSSKLTTQKNKLTAILVCLNSDKEKYEKEIKEYRKKADEISKKYNEFLSKNEKSESQKKNWLEYEDLVDTTNKLKNQFTKLIKIKSKIDNDDFRKIQGYVMLRNQLEYPLRNDFANMMIITKKKYENIDEGERDKNNYLVKNKKNYYYHINNYKNVKRLGSRVYKIPENLQKMIRKFLLINKSGFLFVKPSNRDIALTENDITKEFTKIFKMYYPTKNVSTSMIRHILISNDKKNDPTIKEIIDRKRKIENKYLHSENLNNLYNKV